MPDPSSETVAFFGPGHYAPLANDLPEIDVPIEGAVRPGLDPWCLRRRHLRRGARAR